MQCECAPCSTAGQMRGKHSHSSEVRTALLRLNLTWLESYSSELSNHVSLVAYKVSRKYGKRKKKTGSE